jgi:hypothetical protein
MTFPGTSAPSLHARAFNNNARRHMAPSPPSPAMSRAALLALPLLLAGCLATPTPSGPAPGTTMPGTYAWGLTDCTWLIAFAPVDEAALARVLPAGFTPARDSPLPSPVGDLVAQPSVAVEMFRCASGRGLNGDVAPLDYGSFYTTVTPPDSYRTTATDGNYWLKWTVLVPDAERREALAAGGLDVRGGAVTLEGVDGAQPGSIVQGSLDLEGIGVSRMTFVVRGTGASTDESWFREFTPTPAGGIAVWQAYYIDQGDAAFGRGLLEVPEGSLPAELLGTTRVQTNIATGGFTFRNGTIALPSVTVPAPG